MASARVDKFLSLHVVSHVHVYLSYSDGIEIGLVLDGALDYVMVTHYFDMHVHTQIFTLPLIFNIRSIGELPTFKVP